MVLSPSKVLFFPLILYFAVPISSAETLDDLPYKTGQGDWIINAILTEELSGQKYFLTEYVNSAEYVVRGKISITSMFGTGSVDVFYSSASTPVRTVIKDNQCDTFTYRSSWNKFLFDFDRYRSLQNEVMLSGPSLLMRLDDAKLVWTKQPVGTVRGVQVHSANATLYDAHDITYYAKREAIGQDSSLLKAIRVKFVGYDYTQRRGTPESFNLDIYSFTSSHDLDKVVTITPGIGCSDYLMARTGHQYDNLPDNIATSFRYIVQETVNGPTQSSSTTEVYVDYDYSVGHVKTTSQGITTESIYDYNLGVIYSKNDGERCTVSAMDANTLGINNQGFFSLRSAFGVVDYGFKFIGRIYYERSEIAVDVWETINWNYLVNGVKYDKVVTNQYFVPSDDANVFHNNVLVGININAYKITKTKTYELVESIKKEFFNLEAVQEGSDYETRLTTGDCYPNADQRKTIGLRFRCVGDQNDCQSMAKTEYHQIRRKVKNMLNEVQISVARIENIDVHFDNEQFTATFTVLDIPSITVAMPSKYMKINKNAYGITNGMPSNSEEDCLRKQAETMTSSIKAIIYCGSDRPNNCFITEWLDSIEEDVKSDSSCYVHYTNYQRLYYLTHELTLDRMVERLNKAFLMLELDAYLKGDMRHVSYESVEAYEVQENMNEARSELFIDEQIFRIPQDHKDVQLVTGVTDFISCYHECANSKTDSCETFSFCKYSDKVVCLKSNLNLKKLSSAVVTDADCRTMSRNRLLDYVKIPSRAYKNPSSISADQRLDVCASECSASDECFSFQQCGDSCSFGSYYTDSSTKQSVDCNIYVPKISHNFRTNGQKIVTDVYHTEFNLNLDQCAALCHSWTNGEENCVSYNFCPKDLGPSSCGLSTYSVKNTSVKTEVSNVCQNYELTVVEPQRSQKLNEIIVSSTSQSIFSIIVAFLVVGFIVGMITPFTIVKMRKLWNSAPSHNNKNSFGWSRQVDVENDHEIVATL